MARIRNVKPELRTNLTAAGWPREVRYAWVLLWGYLDDHGRGVDDLRLVCADLFPLDRDVTERKMNGWLDLWAESDSLCRYEVAGRRYLHAVNWSAHQRPSHPRRTSIPPCPRHDSGGPPESFANDSGNPPESLRKDSGGPPESFANDSGNPPQNSPLARALGLGVKGSRGQGLIIRGQGAETDSGKPRADEPAPTTTKPSSTGTRLPDDWLPDDPLLNWAMIDHGFREPFVSAETERFRDYWRGRAGAGGRKADWAATWRNWIRRAGDDNPERATGRARVVEVGGQW